MKRLVTKEVEECICDFCKCAEVPEYARDSLHCGHHICNSCKYATSFKCLVIAIPENPANPKQNISYYSFCPDCVSKLKNKAHPNRKIQEYWDALQEVKLTSRLAKKYLKKLQDQQRKLFYLCVMVEKYLR